MPELQRDPDDERYAIAPNGTRVPTATAAQLGYVVRPPPEVAPDAAARAGGAPFMHGGEQVRMLPSAGPELAAPEPLMSVEPPAPAAPQAPAPNHSVMPPPDVVGPPAANVTPWAPAPAPQVPPHREGAANQLTDLDADEAENIRREMAKRTAKGLNPNFIQGGPGRLVPKHDVDTNYTRGKEMGPDMDRLRHIERQGSGPTSSFEPGEAPKPKYTAQQIGSLFDAPLGANGKPMPFREQQKWAEGVAVDASARGVSMATLAATMPDRRYTPPKPMNGEAVDQWMAEEKRKRADTITAIDAANTLKTAKRDANVTAVQEGEQAVAAKHGWYGEAGRAHRAGVVDANLAEAGEDAAMRAAGLEATHAQQKTAILGRKVKAVDDILANMEKTAAEVAQGKVDPNHYWESKSTGQKIAGAIAIMFGAYGAGKTGGPNVVTQMFEKAIDRDIDAQKANLANGRAKLNDQALLYKMTMERFGNEELAADIVKSASMDLVKADIERHRALATTEKQRIAVDGVLAKIETGQEERRLSISERVNGTQQMHGKVVQDQRVGGGGIDLRARLRAVLGQQVGHEGAARKAMGDEANIVKTGAETGKLGAEAGKAQAGAMGPIIRVQGQQIAFFPGTPEGVITDTTKAVQAANGIRANMGELIKQQGVLGNHVIDRQRAAIIVTTAASQINSTLGGGAMADAERANWIDNLTGLRAEDAAKWMASTGIDNVVNGKLDTVASGRIVDGKLVPFK